MAITVTQVGRRTVFGDRRVGFFDVAFSGNYATGGEAVTASSFGLADIDFIDASAGVASPTNTTAVLVSYFPTNSNSGFLQSWESGAANAPLAEKNNAEAYITGQTARMMVVGH
jgi:hypothetical protein